MKMTKLIDMAKAAGYPWQVHEDYISIIDPAPDGIRVRLHLQRKSGFFDRWAEYAKGELPVTSTASRLREYHGMYDHTDLTKDAADELEAMRAALLRMVENVERWRETGEPAAPEDSKSIYEQMCAAIGREPVA